MEQRTAEIIAICKGQHKFGENLSHKQAILAYIWDRGSDFRGVSDYDAIEHVVSDALFDFIDGVSKPGAFLRNVRDIYHRYNTYLEIKGMDKISFTDAICEAFMLVNVKKGTRFVNGFTEENARVVVEPVNDKSI